MIDEHSLNQGGPTLAAGRPQAARLLLTVLSIINLAIGAYATIAPHSFYRHVLGVDLMGPYDEHLLSDVGGFYLGFGLLFAWAARTLARELVRASAAAFTLTQALHLAYHALHLEHFTAAQAAAQTVGLGVFLALPTAILILCRGAR